MNNQATQTASNQINDKCEVTSWSAIKVQPLPLPFDLKNNAAMHQLWLLEREQYLQRNLKMMRINWDNNEQVS
jgi:hypothetical protein